jgi:hypothetical protein
MGPGTPKGEAPKLRLGIDSSNARRFAHRGLLCTIFSLNARHAEEATERTENASRRRWEEC